MGIIAQEKFVTALTSPKNREMADALYACVPSERLRQLVGTFGSNNRRINRESALEVHAQLREYITTRGYLQGKYLRPWEIDKELYSRMDRTEPWWGFEFETGYRTLDARQAVLEEVWDTLDNTCFDSEGEGRASVEVTFAPEELSKYRDGSSQALKFMDILDKHSDKVYKTANENVGIHINISHPKLVSNNLEWVRYCMVRTIAAIPVLCNGNKNSRKEMFGRSELYGGFFSQRGKDDVVWLEGKLFRTVYTRKEFEKYLKVCEAINTCLDVFVNMEVPKTAPPYHANMNKSYAYISNLYEMAFEGEKPIIKVSTHIGNLDGVRAGNSINGLFAEDNPKLKENLERFRQPRSTPSPEGFVVFDFDRELARVVAEPF